VPSGPEVEPSLVNFATKWEGKNGQVQTSASSDVGVFPATESH